MKKHKKNSFSIYKIDKKTIFHFKAYFALTILFFSISFLFFNWNRNNNPLKTQYKKNIHSKNLRRTEKMSGPFKVWIEKESLTEPKEAEPIESEELEKLSNLENSNLENLKDPSHLQSQSFLLKGNFQILNKEVQNIHFKWVLSPYFEIISGSKEGEIQDLSKKNQISLTVKRINSPKSVLSHQTEQERSPSHKTNTKPTIFLVIKDLGIGLQQTASFHL